MITYPYRSAIILTDDVFNTYGGQNYGSTPTQRNAAYLIAEKQASRHIGTFLLPTQVTGTYNYVQGQPRIVTDYGYVNRLDAVTIWSQGFLTCASCNLVSTSGCGFIADDTYGYIDVQAVLPVASLVNYYAIPFPALPTMFPFTLNYLQPYQFQLSYNAGLPTGTANQADVLLALTLAAQINLNLMVNQSALGGEADIGIDEFSAIDYREIRHKSSVKRTVFGSSATANKVADLLNGAIRPARRSLEL